MTSQIGLRRTTLTYSWRAIFERREVIKIEGGSEDVTRKIYKEGTIDAEFGQDVVSAVLLSENKTGNLTKFELKQDSD